MTASTHDPAGTPRRAPFPMAALLLLLMQQALTLVLSGQALDGGATARLVAITAAAYDALAIGLLHYVPRSATIVNTAWLPTALSVAVLVP